MIATELTAKGVSMGGTGAAGAGRAWRSGGAGVLAIATTCMLLGACSTPGTAPSGARVRGFSPEHLIKTDLNRVAEHHQRQIFLSLRRLAEKLYKRNPAELRKNDLADADTVISRLFDQKHRWRYASLGYRRDLEAMRIALNPEFRGDRVQALILGLASMVQAAFGDREAFYVLDELQPQHLYNAARNVEILAWKLANARDDKGSLLLLSNEMGEVANLSFEREFGRIIGSLDTLADIVEEQTNRNITRAVQNLATAVFLPVF